MLNRLANASSPYLLQHRENPVDWYPWGDEAFAQAILEDKPIFLSIGYSSCHWCHVMAHESFENDEVAAVLNANFISVKVDREEKPDVDEAYMTAIQLTRGRGGWPMSLFLTPDRRPFVATTYIPREGRGEQPGFVEVCRQIADAWRTRRSDVEAVADQLSAGIRETLGQPGPQATTVFDQGFLDRATEAVLSDYDPENGGFGGAPKFPPHTSIEYLISYATETDGPVELREAAAGAALATLRKMCFGGIHDHVGGGFHRYSTDERWLLPHFEKMLTDNALMLSNLARGITIAEAAMPALASTFRSAAEGIVGWLASNMTLPSGLFATAIDADVDGEEGKNYLWTEAEIRQVIGDRADAFMDAYGFENGGNFADEATGRRTGANILHLKQERPGEFEHELGKLLEFRSAREAGLIDEKALVAANGLMITALAENGVVEFASIAADAILAAEEKHGRLPHQIANGEAQGEAFLDGYAYFADALLRLADIADAFAAEGEPIALPRTSVQYREHAARLGGEMIARFYDDAGGGFFFSSDRHEPLFGRSKPMLDQPLPSANAVALRVLIALGAVPRIFQTRDSVLGWLERAPQATGAMLTTLIAVLEETVEPPASDPVSVAVTEAKKPSAEPTVVTLSARELTAVADGYGETRVRINVPAGYHLNSNEPPARWLTPTLVEVQPVRAEVSYPFAPNDRFEGEIEIVVRVALPSGAREAEFELKVSFQACTDEHCLLPEERRFDCVIFK